MLNKKESQQEEIVFHRFFLEYYPSLLSFARHYVREWEVAEDIVQDIFVRLWEGRGKLVEVEDLSAYIYQMVRFRCFNHLRAEKIKNRTSEQMEKPLSVDERDLYVREEVSRIVYKAIETLPPACRTVFSMALEGYDAKEIAEQLKIAVGTVKRQKQIARALLKERLGDLYIFFLMGVISFEK